MREKNSSSKLLTVQQVATLLSVNPSTVRRWAQNHTLIGHKVGLRGDWLFEEALVAQIAQNTKTNHPKHTSVIAGRGHLVQFYENESFLLSFLREFLQAGLRADEICIVVATKNHIETVEKSLPTDKQKLELARQQGHYITLDAEAALARFMEDGKPNNARFMATVGNLIAQSTNRGVPVRVFGEMVALLWREGNPKGATALEVLWNNLGNAYDFSLYCAYPMRLFDRESHEVPLEEIAKLHSEVIPTEDYTLLKGQTDRSFAITLLQQKAEALRGEIAEHRDTEDALRLSELRYKRLFEAATDGIMIVDARTLEVLDANPPVENLLEIATEDIIGKKLIDITPFAYCDRSKAKLLKLPAEKVMRHDLALKTETGEPRDLEIVASLYDEGPNAIIQLNLRDVTERKKAEQLEARNTNLVAERQQLVELNAAKDEFISLASHQLRTPATSVKQYIGMILEGYVGDIPEEQQHLLQQAYESNERQLSTINDLLRIAKLDANKLTLNKVKCDVLSLIKSVIKEQQSNLTRRKQRIQLPKNTEVQEVLADERHLRMVIDNLLDNASKYSPEGSVISVILRQQPDWFAIEILDQGIGIAKEDMAKLFQKFSRIDNSLSISVGGNGLGLYIAKRIIDAHDGEIGVTSTLQKGSVFTIRLPNDI